MKKTHSRNLLGALLAFFIAAANAAPTNGKLQIHFMDVGQGDGAVLISPQGQIVMFDDGNSKACDKPLAYLESLGIASVDYHVSSHYHSDHIGCASQIFAQVQLKTAAYDRGHSYTTNEYQKYIAAVKGKRAAAQIGQSFVLDSGSATPVKITFVAENASTGDSTIVTTNENDLSLVALIEFGGFRAEIGGDLSGEQTGSYKDIETSVSSKVGRLDVYKVHHHCSAYSTNAAWLTTTKPTIGIISVGVANNTYGHPAESCLERLHQAGVKLYLTEVGNGAAPDPHLDTVAGTVLVEVAPGDTKYTVSYGGHSDEFAIVAGGTGPTSTGTPSSPAAHKFAWSKNSNIYHNGSCPVVKNIKSENLVFGETPPAGKKKHDCPDGN